MNQVAGYKKSVYNECQWMQDVDEPVCSTKVDQNGVHVHDSDCQAAHCMHWGYCGPNCPVAPRPTGQTIKTNDITDI